MTDNLAFFVIGFLLGAYLPLSALILGFLFLRCNPHHAHCLFPKPEDGCPKPQ